MPLPAAPHTFALEGCRDLLNKLEWEIEALAAEGEMPELAYRAFNCAVTGWHLSDWVWKAFNAKQRRRFKNRLQEFQERSRHRSPALRHCWLITNASKHGGLAMDWAPEIATEVSADETTPFRVGQNAVGEPLVICRWRITVADQPENQREAVEIFREALAYWTDLIYSKNLD